MSMDAALHLATPRVFVPLRAPRRFKGARGGRGGGKSWYLSLIHISEPTRPY